MSHRAGRGLEDMHSVDKLVKGKLHVKTNSALLHEPDLVWGRHLETKSQLYHPRVGDDDT